jgi:hypothetical protein
LVPARDDGDDQVKLLALGVAEDQVSISPTFYMQLLREWIYASLFGKRDGA